MKDMEQQYKQAQVDAQVAGAVVMENVMACCRGCVDIEIPEGKPQAWSFAGQGNELIWKRDAPFFLPEEEDEEDEDDEGGWGYSSSDPEPTPADGVYWYHGDGGGELIAKAFRERGFEVVWDGTDMSAVLVKFA